MSSTTHKRGQVDEAPGLIFLIIGLVVLVVVFVFLYSSDKDRIALEGHKKTAALEEEVILLKYLQSSTKAHDGRMLMVPELMRLSEYQPAYQRDLLEYTNRYLSDEMAHLSEYYGVPVVYSCEIRYPSGVSPIDSGCGVPQTYDRWTDQHEVLVPAVQGENIRFLFQVSIKSTPKEKYLGGGI